MGSWLGVSPGARLVYAGTRMAPNGVPFDPIFSPTWTSTSGCGRAERLYAFTESRFWGQRTAPGIADPGIDFSKREFDFNFGAAWNYCGAWEARFFAYSLANLNRGNSLAEPFGFKDGIGVENRLYLGATYADLGSPRLRPDPCQLPQRRLPAIEIACRRAGRGLLAVSVRTRLSNPRPVDERLLWLPGHHLHDRAAAHVEAGHDRCGVALRPSCQQQQWEFRAGCENVWDFDGTSRPLGYLMPGSCTDTADFLDRRPPHCYHVRGPDWTLHRACAMIDLRYFKRFRMEMDLARPLPPVPPLPADYFAALGRRPPDGPRPRQIRLLSCRDRLASLPQPCHRGRLRTAHAGHPRPTRLPARRHLATRLRCRVLRDSPGRCASAWVTGRSAEPGRGPRPPQPQASALLL